jgi:hypothetical protein
LKKQFIIFFFHRRHRHRRDILHLQRNAKILNNLISMLMKNQIWNRMSSLMLKDELRLKFPLPYWQRAQLTGVPRRRILSTDWLKEMLMHDLMQKFRLMHDLTK